ncbi:MAG: hypothetical protein JOY64_08375 [Alphaproteobacteria bacterium]|nr:hypothetical protein [Alphaproteobacteria bacterium]MBV8407630.1 hypothetical protein [Alphaproteobacteria bacterium]
MLSRLMSIVACLLACACASTQLNFNTADLASSFNSLTKRQIFFNLAQSLTDPEFVPSQVTISIGTAQTLNSITPSVSVPLGTPLTVLNRTATTGAAIGARNDFMTSAITYPSPTLGMQAVDSWNQSWTMSPVISATQLRRLRTLYQFATGTLPRRDRNTELTVEEAEKIFICEYTLQALSVSPSSGNVVFKLDGCPNNTTRESQSRIVHADPTFTQGASCVICIDDLDAKLLRPHVNPNLKYHFIRTDKTAGMASVGSYGPIGFYVCDSPEGTCPLAPGQQPFDGRKAFSDFILFVYEATTAPSSSGSGRAAGGSFVYSVR